MPLIYLPESSDEHSSAYRDETGAVRYFARNWNTGRDAVGLVEQHDVATVIDMANANGWDRDEIETRLIYASQTDEVESCDHCGQWGHTDDMTFVGEGFYCESCADNLTTTCAECSARVLNENAYWVDEDNACRYCYENHTSYCEHCEATYWDNDSSGHNHECNCEPPYLTVQIPLADGSMWREDESTFVTLPEVIDNAGYNLIYLTLEAHMRNKLDPDVGRHFKWYPLLSGEPLAWKIDGRTYPKRLRSAIYKGCGYSLPNDVVEAVGNIAREHSKPIELTLAPTRDLNMGPDEFANDGSCWWTDYSHSRCALKHADGFGIRSFNKNGHVAGRMWVVPLRAAVGERLITCNTNENAPDAYVVFNSYEELEEKVGVRAFASLLGWEHKHTSISGWSMYINGDGGHLIAPAETIEKISRMDLPTIYAHGQ